MFAFICYTIFFQDRYISNTLIQIKYFTVLQYFKTLIVDVSTELKKKGQYLLQNEVIRPLKHLYP